LKKVLFIDSVHSILAERLTAAGYACEHDLQSSREDLMHRMHPYSGLVLRSRIPIDDAFMQSAPQLKWIARSGSGLENIDLPSAHARGIQVIHSAEGNRDAVGEHVIGLTLNLINKMCQANESVKNGHWLREAHRGRELKHMTFGIIGYGIMGSSVAEKLSGFGCQVIAYDKYKTGFGNARVQEVDLAHLFQEADVVSLHLPQSSETFHYADANFFASFSKPIYFLNTARGKNVHSAALLYALQQHHVVAAGLDVLEFEKASLESLDVDDAATLQELMKLPNVLFTPHVAGWTEESYFKLSEVLAHKIIALDQI
jgi:D-3-phosphoglycerate dehydrogenase / 2-oxoglutarate reductase